MSKEEIIKMLVKIACQLWEVFKGVVPLLVALITISVNGRREKKKDERNKEADEHKAEIERQKEEYFLFKQDLRIIEDNVLTLSGLVWDTGKNLLDAIQHSNEETDYFSEFYSSNKEMLLLARKINGYTDIKLSQHKNAKISFLTMFETITAYSNKLIDILEEYNEKATKTPRCQWETILDETQIRLQEASQGTEDALIKYCCLLDEILLDSPYGQYVAGKKQKNTGNINKKS